MSAASSCCSDGIKRSGLDAAFFGVEVRGWLSYQWWLTLAGILRFNGGTKLYRWSESTVKRICILWKPLSLWTRVCIPFNFFWVPFSVVFNSIREWVSAPTELISSDTIDWPWKSCGLHVDSHDAVRWSTMEILRHRCSRFFAILLAKHSIYNLSDNYRNQIRVKENHFPKPTE